MKAWIIHKLSYLSEFSQLFTEMTIKVNKEWNEIYSSSYVFIINFTIEILMKLQ